LLTSITLTELPGSGVMRGENVGVGVLDEEGVLELLEPREGDGVEENDTVGLEEIVDVGLGV